jgi:hypothetical protein
MANPNIQFDKLTIDASCPGQVDVNTNTQIQGSVDYRLVNTGDQDGVVNIHVTLADSAEHHTDFSSTFQVIPAHGDFSDSHRLFLTVSYPNPVQIDVTMSIEFTGDVVSTTSAECNLVAVIRL